MIPDTLHQQITLVYLGELQWLQVIGFVLIFSMLNSPCCFKRRMDIWLPVKFCSCDVLSITKHTYSSLCIGASRKPLSFLLLLRWRISIHPSIHRSIHPSIHPYIRTPFETAWRVCRLFSGGFRGAYKGILSAAMGSAPGAAMFFSTYETMKKAQPRT